jgi:hypothetical protein
MTVTGPHFRTEPHRKALPRTPFPDELTIWTRKDPPAITAYFQRICYTNPNFRLTACLPEKSDERLIW